MEVWTSTSRRLGPPLALAAVVAAASLPAHADLTDGLIHAPPSSGPYPYSPPGTWLPGQPGFPALRETYVDPIFGSTIRRITDEFPAQSASNIYAANGWWNADGTRFAQDTQTNRVLVDPSTGSIVATGIPYGDIGN